jgi:hypothetical protein
VKDEPIGEEAFLAMLKKPRAYAVWAEQVRKNWTAEQAEATTKDATGAKREKQGRHDD